MIKILAFISVGCWWVFAAIWLMMARGNKASVLAQQPGAKLAYMAPLLIGILMMMNVPVLLAPLAVLGRLLLPFSLITAWAATLCCLSGLALAIWARVTLSGNWSAGVTVKADHALVTSGPYRFVRHPIYSALTLMCLGMFLILPTISSLIGFLLIIASCWIKLRQEEALMLAEFPAAYPAYAAETARLVPFIV